MNSKFERPADTPAAACARCMWWVQKKVDGWGLCVLFRERRYYKCMVCPEYELDPEVIIKLGQ